MWRLLGCQALCQVHLCKAQALVKQKAEPEEQRSALLAASKHQQEARAVRFHLSGVTSSPATARSCAHLQKKHYLTTALLAGDAKVVHCRQQTHPGAALGLFDFSQQVINC